MPGGKIAKGKVAKGKAAKGKITKERSNRPPHRGPRKAGHLVRTPPKHTPSTPDENPNDTDDDDEVSESEESLAKKAAFFAPAEAADENAADQPTTESFAELQLSRPILKALAELGWTQPTAIQRRAIPLALRAVDLCGAAVTGSGKTGAFMIPVLERLLYRPKRIPTTRVLVLVPTRELGAQVHAVTTGLAAHTDITATLCVGGLPLRTQEAELRRRPDIVIATPGRLIDHVRNAASFSVDGVEILIMDEADRMLEEGFAAELDEIIKFTPRARQTMLFSATMTDRVDDLIKLSLQRPVRLFVDSTQAMAQRLHQEFVRIREHREADRLPLLLALCGLPEFSERTIVFFKAKRAAHHAKIVFGLLGMAAAELHGDLTQPQRLESLERFRAGDASFLLATDVAARGLDISHVRAVINHDMPATYSQYVHRVGRTARASQGGRAVSFVCERDRKILKLAVKNMTNEIVHRVVPVEQIEGARKRVAALDEQIKLVEQAEAEERALQRAEMEADKAQNLLQHADEIRNRPRRTWFEDAGAKRRRARGA